MAGSFTQSRTIIQALENKILELGASIATNCEVVSVTKPEDVFIVKICWKNMDWPLIGYNWWQILPFHWLYWLRTQNCHNFKHTITDLEADRKVLFWPFPHKALKEVSLTDVTLSAAKNIITHDLLFTYPFWTFWPCSPSRMSSFVKGSEILSLDPSFRLLLLKS